MHDPFGSQFAVLHGCRNDSSLYYLRIMERSPNLHYTLRAQLGGSATAGFFNCVPLCLRPKKPSTAVTQKPLFLEGQSLSRAEKQATDEGFNRLRKN
jgi:hypothetical protein